MNNEQEVSECSCLVEIFSIFSLEECVSWEND